MLELFTELVRQYGYAIVVITIMLECAGIPMPGETALIVAAAFAGIGTLNIYLVITVAALAAIIGDAGGYWVGRYFGRGIINRYGKWIHLTPSRMKIIEEYFDKHGAKTVFFGRYFTILRTYSALFAGICRMPYLTFTQYNALGGICWSITFGVLGYVFGQNLPLLEKIAKTVGWALTLPLVSIAVLILLWRWVLKNQEKIVSKAKQIAAQSFITAWIKSHTFQINWLLRHWKARQYIIMHLSAGFIIITLTIAVFGNWIFNPLAKGAISGFDQSMYQFFVQEATPFATTIFTAIAYLGSASLLIFGILGSVFLGLKGRNVQLATWLTGLIGGQLLTAILKISVARPYPVLQDLFTTVLDFFNYSFPSGNAVEAIVVYGLLTYYIIIHPGTWLFKTGIITLSLAVIVLIGFSRMYMGANYCSDIIGGYITGIFWLITCISAAELSRRDRVGDRRRTRRAKPKTPAAVV